MSDSRRKFLQKAALIGTGGALLGAASPARRFVPITDGDDLNARIIELEEFLQPGVSISVSTTIHLDEENRKQLGYNTFVNIDLTPSQKVLDRLYQNQTASQFLINSRDIDRPNLVKVVTSVAGPYTLVAVVGSAVAEVSDRATGDIDVLVLNGGREGYSSPNPLFDNQALRIYDYFRPAHGNEIIDILRQYNPRKAEMVREDLTLKSQGLPGLWYGPNVWHQFLFPQDLPYPSVPDLVSLRDQKRPLNPDELPKPIHLLAPQEGKEENIAYNAERLVRALTDGKAIVLYQGEHNKLI